MHENCVIRGGAMCVFCPFLFPSRRVKTWTLSSEYKFTKLILWVGYPSYNRTSQRKSAFIYKASVKIPKAFSQYDTAGKIK